MAYSHGTRHRSAPAGLALAFCCLLSRSRSLEALDPRKALTQFARDAWTSDQGLPQNSVNAIVQSPDGYLWLATQEGVARFDGARFVVFDPRNSGL